jgi:TatD DNase family protein
MIEYIDIHTHQTAENENTFSVINVLLPEEHFSDSIFLSAGWHPWNIENSDLHEIETELELWGRIKNVLLIGECGIDRNIETSVAKQTEVLILHFIAAQKFDKPLIIHCVKAYSDIEHLIKSRKYQGKIIFHNFNGNRVQIGKLLRFNVYFSLGEQFMNKKSTIRKSFKEIPVDRVFFETDESDLKIDQLYEEYALFKGIDLETLKNQIKLNFYELTGRSTVR